MSLSVTRHTALVVLLMNVFQQPAEFQARVRERRRSSRTVGVVPTMGALHEGHLSLVAAARSECDVVITTIFVNPTQFGLGEDFEQYPRRLESDLELCRSAGTDLVFAPSVNDMYLSDNSTMVRISGLAQVLEGASRPTHFDGVTTVVAKLLNITQPDRAYFGQKDYQQQLIIRRMVRDLNWPVDIINCPIIREPDGLAMSSRNRFLSARERAQALVLNRTLVQARWRAAEERTSPERVQAEMQQQLQLADGVEPDYAMVVDAETLRPAGNAHQTAVALVAARVGRTRLIDNQILTFSG